jgi:4'-phosphopantetheinyl transferase EntD
VGYFAMLLDPRIAVAEAPLRGQPPDPPADEALSIVNAVPRRRLEFATGRECARQAMAALGHAKVSIPRAQDRVPIWPDDLVGSIISAGHIASAVVVTSEHVR